MTAAHIHQEKRIVNYLMSINQGTHFTPAGSPRTFDKQALRVGTYVHPREGWRLSIDHDRIDRIVQTFNELRANGVSVDITLDHSSSARDVVGKITGAHRDGDWLILTHEFTDDDGVKIAKRVQESSIELEPELIDGHGRRYVDALVANSIARKPVVPNQGPFTRIAASREGGERACLPFHLAGSADPTAPSPWVRELLDEHNSRV